MCANSVYGIRAAAAVSLLSGVAMLFVSVYVFIARVEDLLQSKFQEAGVPLNISRTGHPHKNNEDYTKLVHSINDLWISYRPILVSSSMLAILTGFLQIIFSGLLALADKKVIPLYIRKWVTTHFILVFLLFIILLNTIVLTESRVDKDTWDTLIASLKKTLKDERPANNYSSFFTFLGVNQHLIYISVSVNLAVILITMGTMMFIMQRNKEYESIE